LDRLLAVLSLSHLKTRLGQQLDQPAPAVGVVLVHQQAIGRLAGSQACHPALRRSRCSGLFGQRDHRQVNNQLTRRGRALLTGNTQLAAHQPHKLAADGQTCSVPP
jgi:hypothetical protein